MLASSAPALPSRHLETKQVVVVMRQAEGIEIVAHVTSLVYAAMIIALTHTYMCAPMRLVSCLLACSSDLACFFFCFSVRASSIRDSIVCVRVHYYAKRMRTCAHVRHDKTRRARLVMDRVPV
jgi:hypothetical protein